MRDENNNPRRSGGYFWGYHQLSVGTIRISSGHLLDLLPFLLYSFKVLAFDLDHGIRVWVCDLCLMARIGFAGLAIGNGDVLTCNIPAPVISLGIRSVLGPRVHPRRGVRLFDFHGNSLLVWGLMALAVVPMLVGVVALVVSTKQMGVPLIVVGVLATVFNTRANALAFSHFVVDMVEMGTKMPFLGVGIKDFLLAFHGINMFAQNFAMGTIGKCLGGDDHRCLGEGGMAWGLNGAGANSLMVLDLQDFGNAAHWYHLSWVARKRANSADHRHTFMIQSFQGAASV